MKVDARPESVAEYEAAGLAMYASAWLIWRSERFDGEPAAWCATRRDRAGGEPYTIHRDTARQLAIKLAEETRTAQLREEFAADPGGR